MRSKNHGMDISVGKGKCLDISVGKGKGMFISMGKGKGYLVYMGKYMIFSCPYLKCKASFLCWTLFLLPVK